MKTPPQIRKPLLAVCSLFVVAALAAPLSVRAQAKWNPGHYARLGTERWNNGVMKNTTTNLQIANSETCLKGIQMVFTWRVLEGGPNGVQDVYDFSRIDTALAALAPGKKLIIDVWDADFNGSWGAFDSTVLPAYLNSPDFDDGQGNQGYAVTTSGGCSKAWVPAVMDRLIKLFQALAAKYDNDPRVEMFAIGESARSINPLPAGFTRAAWLNEWSRFVHEVRKAAPNTNLQIGTNFAPYGEPTGAPNLKALIDECLHYTVFAGGPDIMLLPDSTRGREIVNNISGSQCYDPARSDLRGAIALRYDQQFVFDHTTYTPSSIYAQGVTDTSATGNRCNYIAWASYHTSTDGPHLIWATDVLPFLRLNPSTVTTMPTTYNIRGWLGFNESSGTAMDTSGVGSNATLQNGATFAAGMVGNALNLDGVDDYASLPAGQADFTTGMTIALWAYPTTAGNNARFVEFGNGTPSENIMFGRKGTTGDMRLKVYSGATSAEVVATGAIALNTWQHFAVTMDNTGAVILYKNGVQVGTGTVPLPANVTRNSNYVGKSLWGTDPYYGGKIDELHIYARPLAASEIQGLMGTGTTPVAAVQGQSITIPDGDATPRTSDDTDFGNADITSGLVAHTFTIRNNGSTTLTLSSVTVGGTHAGDFAVTTQPATSVLPWQSTTCVVQFNPSATGLRSATLSTTTNDPAIGTYNFSIQGTGTDINLIANPGFETTASWTNYPGTYAIQDVNSPHSGTYRLKITGNGYPQVYQAVAVTPGITYIGRVWNRAWSADGTARAQMVLQFYQNTTALGSPTTVTSGTGDSWTQLVSSGITAPSNATHLRMTLQRSGTVAGNYYFDDAEIK